MQSIVQGTGIRMELVRGGFGQSIIWEKLLYPLKCLQIVELFFYLFEFLPHLL